MNMFHNCCRICLEEKKLLKSTLTTFNGHQRYDEIFEFCTGIEISDDNNIMPVSICLLCERLLLRSNELKKRAIKSQSTLEAVLKLSQEITLQCENDELFEFEGDDEAYEMNVPRNSSVCEDEIENVRELDCTNGWSYDECSRSNVSKDLHSIKTECSGKEICHDVSTERNCENILFLEKESDGFGDNNSIYSQTDHVLNTLDQDDQALAISHRSKIVDMNERNGKPSHRLCEICGNLIGYGYFRDHFKAVHSKQERYQCPECNKTLKHKNGLRLHMRIHSSHKRYECHICGERFIHWPSRRHHIAVKHGYNYQFQCPICDRKLINKTMYNHHMTKHTGERPYKCEACPAEFRTSSSLKNHKETHAEDRKHMCEICDKKFRSRPSLVNHMRIHSGERNYVCSICSKAFIQNHVLRGHMKTHLKTHPDLVIPPPGTIVSQAYWRRMKEREESSKQYDCLS